VGTPPATAAADPGGLTPGKGGQHIERRAALLLLTNGSATEVIKEVMA
jgi:hypothetical protein